MRQYHGVQDGVQPAGICHRQQRIVSRFLFHPSSLHSCGEPDAPHLRPRLISRNTASASLSSGRNYTGPHLYEFSPGGTSSEYFAVSSARAARVLRPTSRGTSSPMPTVQYVSPLLSRMLYKYMHTCVGSLEDLIRGLHALRETL